MRDGTISQLITHRYRLEDAPEAYLRSAAGESGKVVFRHHNVAQLVRRLGAAGGFGMISFVGEEGAQ